MTTIWTILGAFAYGAFFFCLSLLVYTITRLGLDRPDDRRPDPFFDRDPED